MTAVQSKLNEQAYQRLLCEGIHNAVEGLARPPQPIILIPEAAIKLVALVRRERLNFGPEINTLIDEIEASLPPAAVSPPRIACDADDAKVLEASKRIIESHREVFQALADGKAPAAPTTDIIRE